jgi:hypothetical protein
MLCQALFETGAAQNKFTGLEPQVPSLFLLYLFPSGKRRKKLWKITILNVTIHYKWSCSIVMLNYQGVTLVDVLFIVSPWRNIRPAN